MIKIPTWLTWLSRLIRVSTCSGQRGWGAACSSRNPSIPIGCLDCREFLDWMVFLHTSTQCPSKKAHVTARVLGTLNKVLHLYLNISNRRTWWYTNCRDPRYFNICHNAPGTGVQSAVIPDIYLRRRNPGALYAWDGADWGSLSKLSKLEVRSVQQDT